MKKGIIYQIRNLKNEKVYIGSSNNLKKRWNDHKYLLNKNSHHSYHLQRSWNKYGEDSFVFEILEECDEDVLLYREQYYLDTILEADLYIKGEQSIFLKRGYNIQPYAFSNLGFKQRPETIEKALKTRDVKVLAVDLAGNIVGEFLTSGFAAAKFNINISRIQTSLKYGTCPKDLNIGFIYEKKYYVGFIPKIHRKKISKIKERNKSSWKEVYVYDRHGFFIEKIENQLLCSFKYNIDPPNLCRSLNTSIFRDDKLPKNFIFSRQQIDKKLEFLRDRHKKILNFGTDIKKYCIKDRDGNILSYTDDFKDLVPILNCSVNILYSILCGSRQFIKNYTIEKTNK